MADIFRSFGKRLSSRFSSPPEPVLPPIRRVVTGHNATGHAIVKSDMNIAPQPATGPGSEGLSGGALWTTESVPSRDTNDDSDGALRPVDGFVMRDGTNLRFTDLAPGFSSPMHRTSSVDYNILISGKLILVLDDGSETLIRNPGDVVVQRGNIHAWRNPGPNTARWVSVLVDAERAVVKGEALEDAWLA